MTMILSVYDHEKTTNIEVPVNPDSTFVDVLRCCKGLADKKYYITGMFPNREERIVEPYDRPYEFVKKNGNIKQKFVIYKTGNDNIFFKDANGYQDKKRFTLTDLANFVSYHEKVVEQHNKTIHAMEERLKKLRKEETIRKRGETNLLALMESAEVQERRIDLIRKQKGLPLPQKLRKAQGTTLEELKVLFRTTDDEVKKLKDRIEASVRRIESYEESRENSEDRENLPRDLKIQNYAGKSIMCDEWRNGNVKNKRFLESTELDMKIKDLRNRLNLDRKSITSSLKMSGISGPSEALGTSNVLDGNRQKSAFEILLKPGQSLHSKPSSDSPASSSSFNDTLPLSNLLETVSSSTDVAPQCDVHNVDCSVSHTRDVLNSKIQYTQQDLSNLTSSSSSSIETINNQPIDRDKSLINVTSSTGPDLSKSYNHGHNKIQDSSDQKSAGIRPFPSFTPIPSSAPPASSHKRRQRAAAQLGDSASTVIDNNLIISASTNQPPLITKKPTTPFIKPTTKTYFQKVFQQTKDDGKMSDNFTTSQSDPVTAIKDIERLEKKANIENVDINHLGVTLKGVIPHDIHSERSESYEVEVVEDYTSMYPSENMPNGAQTKTDETPTQTAIPDFSPSHTPNSSNISLASPVVQVTPMSTTSANFEVESDIFNITGNQSDIGFSDNEISAVSFRGSPPSQFTEKIQSLKSSIDDDPKQIEHQNEIKHDSFFSIPSMLSQSFSVQEDNKVVTGNEVGDPSPEVTTESFATPSYPFPFIEVLEQLDGSASIFRHSAGGIRSLRKRLSADDFHLHGEVPPPDDAHCNFRNNHFLTNPEIINNDVTTTTSGLQADFKPKCLPRQYFTDFSFGITTSTTDNVSLNDRSLADLKETESIQKSIGKQLGSLELKDKCNRSMLPDIVCTEGSTMEYISFKDNLGKENEIIVISPKEKEESDEKEPGIIVVGEEEIVSEEEDDGTCSDDNEDDTSTSDAQANDDDDDDRNGSFSPLIDNFCEVNQNKPVDVDIVPRPDRLGSPSIDGSQAKTCGIANEEPSVVSNLETPILIKGILTKNGSTRRRNEFRVVFSPLAILLDAALQGELDVVEDIVNKHGHTNMVNDEGITALHNAICAGHEDIARFLVVSGCDVNAADSDLWTPLHCAASCYNIGLIQLLVESGACIFATTESEGETALDKCEDEEEDGGRCKKYLREIQAKMMCVGAELYAAYDSQSSGSDDELHFAEGDVVVVCNPGMKITKGERNNEEEEDEDCYVGEGWCLARNKQTNEVGYTPKNYLSLFPRVSAKDLQT